VAKFKDVGRKFSRGEATEKIPKKDLKIALLSLFQWWWEGEQRKKTENSKNRPKK